MAGDVLMYIKVSTFISTAKTPIAVIRDRRRPGVAETLRVIWWLLFAA
jgi:hypothetical protein